MRVHFIIVLVIVVVSGAAGGAANLAWYKMDWVREQRPVVNPGVVPIEGTGGPCDPSRSKPGFVLIDCVLEHLANSTASFIDARESRDYDEARLAGAYHLPSSAIYDNIDGLYARGIMEDQTIIIYCGGGNCEASHNVADALRNDFEFTNVFIYEKGWEEVETSGRFGEYIEMGVLD